MKKFHAIVTALAMSFFPVGAIAADDAATRTAVDTLAAPDNSQTTEGEIRKVDKDGGRITIKHGAIKNLDMPAMTMVFRVKNANMLDKLKAGDKINFSAENIDGKFTVTRIEAAK